MLRSRLRRGAPLILTAAMLVAAGLLALVPAGEPSALERSALAQTPNRPRGQYLLVSGRMNGQTANAIYILDTANQELLAVRWERSRNDFVGLGYRSVAEDGKVAGGGR